MNQTDLKELQTLLEELSELDSDISSIRSDIDDQESSCTEIVDLVDDLKNTLSNADADFAALERKVNNMHTVLEALIGAHVVKCSNCGHVNLEA